MNLINKISELISDLYDRHLIHGFMRAVDAQERKKAKSIADNIAYTVSKSIPEKAANNVLRSLNRTEKVGDKRPDELLFTKYNTRLSVGRFKDMSEAFMFMKQFRKFVSEFEKKCGYKIVYIYNPYTEEQPPEIRKAESKLFTKQGNE